jgi:hypothetical protein
LRGSIAQQFTWTLRLEIPFRRIWNLVCMVVFANTPNGRCSLHLASAED